MTKYANTIYPDTSLNDYPQKLCDYISSRFFRNKGRLLDVGCGRGMHLKCFSENKLECYGVDLRNECIKEFVVKECNVEKDNIPFYDNFFDYVYSKSLIEHVVNVDNFFSNVLRVLKPGGIFVCMTPDWKSQMSHFFDDYTHVHPFTRKSLRDALSINGFKDATCEYFYQLPFIWKYPCLKFVPIVVSAATTQNMKWKNEHERNGEDRKLIRFSKEKMLLACGIKE
jgi:ubiquinone/menaquinone biosynthesis C-methylase UbiE